MPHNIQYAQQKPDLSEVMQLLQYFSPDGQQQRQATLQGLLARTQYEQSQASALQQRTPVELQQLQAQAAAEQARAGMYGAETNRTNLMTQYMPDEQARAAAQSKATIGAEDARTGMEQAQTVGIQGQNAHQPLQQYYEDLLNQAHANMLGSQQKELDQMTQFNSQANPFKLAGMADENKMKEQQTTNLSDANTRENTMQPYNVANMQSRTALDSGEAAGKQIQNLMLGQGVANGAINDKTGLGAALAPVLAPSLAPAIASVNQNHASNLATVKANAAGVTNPSTSQGQIGPNGDLGSTLGHLVTQGGNTLGNAVFNTPIALEHVGEGGINFFRSMAGAQPMSTQVPYNDFTTNSIQNYMQQLLQNKKQQQNP